MEALTLVMLTALVVKVTGVLKSIGKNNNAVITQLLTWAVGVGVAILAAHASVTSALVFAGQPLGSLDVGSQVLAGLSFASGGSFAYDFKKAIDGSDSAAEPPLLPPAG